jgi:hypothetical protein
MLCIRNKCYIYHSHVSSCNLSSIRIIIYSAAEAQELRYAAGEEAFAHLLTPAFLK